MRRVLALVLFPLTSTAGMRQTSVICVPPLLQQYISFRSDTSLRSGFTSWADDKRFENLCRCKGTTKVAGYCGRTFGGGPRFRSDFLHQLEVYLVAVEVDAGDLDGDFVAEDKVLGVFDGDHGDESFAAGGLELDKEAEIGYAGDEAGEDLAHMVFHPHGLEHLDGVAFGPGSLLFARRAVLAFILQFFARQCFFFPGEDIFLHEAVDHEVGIATDGRGKMGVMTESKAIMADVVSRVNGLCLGTDSEHIDRPLDRFLRDLMMSHFGGHGTLAFELLHFLEFFGVRQVMNAIDEGSTGTDGFGYRTVGEEHELLDEVVRFVRLLKIDLRWEAVLIQTESHLVLLDGERSAGNPFGAEFLSHFVESCQGFRDLGITRCRGLDNSLRFVVIKTCIGADDGAADLIFEYPRVGVHREDDGHAEFVFAGSQRTFVVTQFFGQHGDHAVDEIDGCTALVGLVIDLRAGFDIERHICDVDADLVEGLCRDLVITWGRDQFKRQGIIEVFGIGGIDGESEDLAHVPAAYYFVGYIVLKKHILLI